MLKKKTTFLGIDPGLDGGLVLLSEEGEILEKHIVPTIENVTMKKSKTKKDPDTGKMAMTESVKRSIDGVALNRILVELASRTTHAILEQVASRPGMSAPAVFKFGQVYGIIEGLLIGNKIPYMTVIPAVWCRVIHAGIPGDDPKARSLVALNRLFPSVDLRVSARASKPHEGLMDALLLAEFGRRKAKIGEL